MSSICAQQVQQYLQDHDYLKPDQLAARTGTTKEQILALEQARCIPAASYVIGGEMTFTSTFGSYNLSLEPERYYHPSIEKWAISALSLAQTRELCEVATIVRSEFDKNFHEALNDEPPPWPDGADYAWNYMTDGTWGLCLKDITIDNLLTKEYARATIRQIVSSVQTEDLPAGERERLIAAILAYRRVTMPFAPHEFDQSSTRLEVQAAIDRYHIGPDELTS